MIALILAGGYARRLAPITDFLPKPLLPLGGKPMIEYIIEKIEKIGDIYSIIISTNAKFADQFEYWITNKHGSNYNLVVEPTLEEEKKFGAIAGINYAIEKMDIKEDLLIVAGDNIFDFSLLDFISFAKSKEGPTLGLYDIQSLEEARRFGVMEIGDNNEVISFEEKPEKPKSTLVSAACYYFPKELLDMFKKYLDEGENPDAPGYFIQWLHKNITVYGYSFSGKWYDIGTLKSYEEAFKEYENIY